MDGIVLAGEKRFINKLLDESAFSEKIFRINDDIACAVAGITADATVLIKEMRLIAQRCECVSLLCGLFVKPSLLNVLKQLMF